MYTLLAQHLQKHIDISLEEAQDFCQLFELKCFKKKEFLLTQGEICKMEAFVISGLFKVFHLDNESHEQILYFGVEDWWLSDLDSFFYQIPSKLNLQRRMIGLFFPKLQSNSIVSLGSDIPTLPSDFLISKWKDI